MTFVSMRCVLAFGLLALIPSPAFAQARGLRGALEGEQPSSLRKSILSAGRRLEVLDPILKADDDLFPDYEPELKTLYRSMKAIANSAESSARDQSNALIVMSGLVGFRARANSSRKLAKKSQALRERATQLDPDNPRVWRVQATVYAALDRQNGFKKRFIELGLGIKIVPLLENALQNLDRLEGEPAAQATLYALLTDAKNRESDAANPTLLERAAKRLQAFRGVSAAEQQRLDEIVGKLLNRNDTMD